MCISLYCYSDIRRNTRVGFYPCNGRAFLGPASLCCVQSRHTPEQTFTLDNEVPRKALDQRHAIKPIHVEASVELKKTVEKLHPKNRSPATTPDRSKVTSLRLASLRSSRGRDGNSPRPGDSPGLRLVSASVGRDLHCIRRRGSGNDI